MREQAKHIGLPMTRIPAVEGLKVPPTLAPYFAHIKYGKPPIIDDGAIGCYASHLSVWREIIHRGHQIALVLEDDAELCADFVSVLAETIAALPPGWDIAHLSKPS